MRELTTVERALARQICTDRSMHGYPCDACCAKVVGFVAAPATGGSAGEAREQHEKMGHPNYGTCDGFGPNGTCSICTGFVFTKQGDLVANDGRVWKPTAGASVSAVTHDDIVRVQTALRLTRNSFLEGHDEQEDRILAALTAAQQGEDGR